MLVTLLVSSLIIAITVITTVGLKWRLGFRTPFVSGVCIGFLTFVVVYIFKLLIAAVPLVFLLIIEFVVIGLLTLLAIVWRFFRDPDREIPKESNIIVSPADGCVQYIKPIKSGEMPVTLKKGRMIPLIEMTQTDMLNDSSYLIGIEMNVLDVHVNRSPIHGEIVHHAAIPGKFLSLRDDIAVSQNERVTTVIRNEDLTVGMVQIASRLVRRIVSYKTKGETVKRGQRIGMIKFGSQVDVILPRMPSQTVHVKVGDRVTAGSTILCHYSHSSNA